jgi:hypothetical protein
MQLATDARMDKRSPWRNQQLSPTLARIVENSLPPLKAEYPVSRALLIEADPAFAESLRATRIGYQKITSIAISDRGLNYFSLWRRFLFWTRYAWVAR